MSLQEVSPEQLAELLHRYHQVLAPDFERNSGANDENWQHISEQEKNRLIAAAHLALTELRGEAKQQEDRSRYFAKPGEAEWGC
jgi:ribosomal protein S17E